MYRIKFKGIDDEIQAIVAFSAGDVDVNSQMDLVNNDKRQVMHIHFPENTNMDVLMKAYTSEDALSEIAIINEDTSEAFIHLNYMIQISLALQPYGTSDDIAMYGPNRWIMSLAQLTEADKQFRQLVGETAKNVNYMSLDEYRNYKIGVSKSKLNEYLENNCLISDCKDGIFAPYTATLEKQNLFSSQYAAYLANKMAGIEDVMTWNEHGKSCVPWTDETCIAFINAMKAYVKPLVSAQQHYEEQINTLTTKAELEAFEIDYSVVETINGKESWIGHTKAEVERMNIQSTETPEKSV